MDEGYLLVLCTTPGRDDNDERVLDALRLTVRSSFGGVLAVSECVPPWSPAPVAMVTRRRLDGAMEGPTRCFGPLTGSAQTRPLCRWLEAGGPAVRPVPADLAALQLRPPVPLAASTNPN